MKILKTAKTAAQKLVPLHKKIATGLKPKKTPTSVKK